MLKRIFDLFFSLLGLFLLLPVFSLIALWIKLDSRGGIFFRQKRVGLSGKSFYIHKFRTMVTDAESKGMQITVGADARITRSGKFLRRYKLDELPQLIDVLVGNMSLVGPRPEVPRYVACYPDSVKKEVLSVKPGITDLASIEFKDENALLGQSNDPEKTYKEEVLPIKLGFATEYVRHRSLSYDFKVILRTLHALFTLSRWQKRIVMVLADLILIPVALWASYAMRLGDFTPQMGDGIWLMPVAVLVSTPVFIKLGLYHAVVRFISNKALSAVFLGVSISAIGLIFTTLFLGLSGVPRSVFIIYWGTAFLLIGGSRYLVRRYYHFINNTSQREYVAIYGAGQSGAELAQMLFDNTDYRPTIFLDDNKSLQGAFVHGLKVCSPEDLPNLIELHQIKQVLLAMPMISATRRREVIGSLEPFPLHIRTIPDITELVSGRSSVDEIREIKIDDLLGRVSVAPDPSLLNYCIKNKNILVTGAGGSIGSELCRQIIYSQPRRLVLFERSEFDLYKLEQELLMLTKHLVVPVELVTLLGSVKNEKRVSSVLRGYHINTVYHAAAYKHVPLVEHNPVEGIQNNVLGTFLVAQASLDAGVDHFVLISTDKAVRPTNVMGASKRLAELGVQALAKRSKTTKFSMVRFGNVLGSSGSVVPLFRKQILSGGPVTVTHRDMIRYFMTIPEAAQLVIQAGAMSKGGEVFLLDMGEPVKILDLAQKMIHLTGLVVKKDGVDGDIAIEFTGLRPGEKLYEELLIDGSAYKTTHPRIFQANEKKLGWDEYKQVLTDLINACEEQDKQKLFHILEMYVSGYKNSNCGEVIYRN